MQQEQAPGPRHWSTRPAEGARHGCSLDIEQVRNSHLAYHCSAGRLSGRCSAARRLPPRIKPMTSISRRPCGRAADRGPSADLADTLRSPGCCLPGVQPLGRGTAPALQASAGHPPGLPRQTEAQCARVRTGVAAQLHPTQPAGPPQVAAQTPGGAAGGRGSVAVSGANGRHS